VPLMGDMHVACAAVLQRLGRACHPVSAVKHGVQADGGLLTMVQQCLAVEALSSTQLPVLSTTIVSTLHRHMSAVDTTNACGRCVAGASCCRRLQQETVPPLLHQRRKQRGPPEHRKQQRLTGQPL
jgi:hypothetical protein